MSSPARWTTNILRVPIFSSAIDQEPFFRTWLGPLVIAVGRAHAHNGETGIASRILRFEDKLIHSFLRLGEYHSNRITRTSREVFDASLIPSHKARLCDGSAP